MPRALMRSKQPCNLSAKKNRQSPAQQNGCVYEVAAVACSLGPIPVFLSILQAKRSMFATPQVRPPTA